MILDGWGLAPPGPGNALSLATLKNVPRYMNAFPHAQLTASGVQVGLPAGEDGNTETGHINIGAGRIVYQDLPRINMSISDGSFYRNDALISACTYVKTHSSRLHLMGLISDSGVHASREHLYALLEFVVKRQETCPIYLHLFTDGRDSPPNAGLRFIRELEAKIEQLKSNAVIATLMGRYYGMDRDRRWERTERAYQALTEDIPSHAESAEKAIEASYAKNVLDEFVEPVIINDKQGVPCPRIQPHDAVIFYNYRIDRPRQLTRAFVLPDFETHQTKEDFDPYAVKYHHKHVVEEDTRKKPFTRRVVLSDLFFVTMTEYERNLPCSIAFPLEQIQMPLGQVFSEAGIRQLRVTETEKERFIGYYFNGMREESFTGEDRIIIPSPNVPTYDLQPEMSAHEVTKRVIDRLTGDVYGFIAINFPNTDMVAHTGNIKAAIKAAEIVDECVGKIVTMTMNMGGTCVITADHGNVEEMLGPNGEMDTEHSTYPVPLIIISEKYQAHPMKLPSGKLADVAPTILSIADIHVPSAMTGQSLLKDLVV